MSQQKIHIRIEGLQEAIDALRADIVAIPARRLLSTAGLFVQETARNKAPIFDGGLRDKITHVVDSSYFPKSVQIGSNSVYARATELGREPGKMPPVKPLEDWARRKGMGSGLGWPLAMKIKQKGTAPQPYLRPALDELEPRIPELLAIMARDIERRAAAAGRG